MGTWGERRRIERALVVRRQERLAPPVPSLTPAPNGPPGPLEWFGEAEFSLAPAAGYSSPLAKVLAAGGHTQNRAMIEAGGKDE
jgi:hypothetical protein